ncbi:KH domain-containing protein, partial [Tanacetum coccineum]
MGRGGEIVKQLRTETKAKIRIGETVNGSDERVVSGEASSVRKALYQVAARLHDNPSRTQHLLNSSTPNAYPGAGALMGTTPGAPIMGLSSLVGAYGGYK